MPADYIDLDVYGRTSPSGQPIELVGSDAVINSITAFLLSKKGDYLNKPNFGGPVDSILFKALKDDYSAEQASIGNAITSAFGGVCTLNGVTIVPDYFNKFVEISVSITVISNNTTSVFSVFKRASFNYVEEKSYIDVPFFGINLVGWLAGTLLDQPKSPLLFNDDVSSWVWNDFKLINLSVDSDEFQYVYDMITNYNLSNTIPNLDNLDN